MPNSCSPCSCQTDRHLQPRVVSHVGSLPNVIPYKAFLSTDALESLNDNMKLNGKWHSWEKMLLSNNWDSPPICHCFLLCLPMVFPQIPSSLIQMWSLEDFHTLMQIMHCQHLGHSAQTSWCPPIEECVSRECKTKPLSFESSHH